MDNKERLQKLKQLQVKRVDGPLFKSEHECMEWIDNVAPLLKYDENHYQTFINNAQYVRITTLSADRLMSHLNPMIGVVNQAISELENKITSTPPSHINKKAWHEGFIGKIIVGVIIGIIILVIGIFIKKDDKDVSSLNNTYYIQNPVEEKINNEQLKSTEKIEPQTQQPIPKEKILIQSHKSEELYDGDLTVTLSSTVNFHNSKINLTVSTRGKEAKTYKDLAVGDKIFHESYEITFIETQRNITDYDVWLRIIKIKKTQPGT